jgi:hypothetical protein
MFLRQRHFQFSIILLVTLLLQACHKKENNSSIEFYKNYFDTTKGRFIEYQVREITHNINSQIQHDTSNYFLRIQIEDTLIDNLGRRTNKYVRYKRFSENETWVISDIWTTLVHENNAELTEENQRTIKLKFPVNSFTTWNANVFNANEPLDCSYKEIHKKRTINGFDFDSTVTVDQGTDRNLIRLYRKYEIYAKGIGMVHKYYKDLEIANFDTLNIKSGKELIYILLQYGIE